MERLCASLHADGALQGNFSAVPIACVIIAHTESFFENSFLKSAHNSTAAFSRTHCSPVSLDLLQEKSILSLDLLQEKSILSLDLLQSCVFLYCKTEYYVQTQRT